MKSKKYYVSMTDKFMSGWGYAENKINKFVVICNTPEQAMTIKRNAIARSEMKYINIHNKMPKYKSNYLVSIANYDELGSIWKK